MTFATILTAAIGYALVYAAMPNRDALRSRTRAGVRRLLVMGLASLLLSAVLGAIAFGPAVGPFVTCAVALAVGSVLVLAVPLVGTAAVREAQSVATRAAREAAEG
jgi:uncharacterized membrane protein